MYLLYVDESGNANGTQERHFVLGATAVFESTWRYLRADVDDLLAQRFDESVRPREIHCQRVRSGREHYRKWSVRDRLAFLGDYASRVAARPENELRLFAVATDKVWWHRKYPDKNGEDLYLQSFENLVSRFNYFLVRQHKLGRPNRGAIVVDFSNGDLASALRSGLERARRDGTRWLNNIHNIVETVMFLPSHESPGLQIADLCSHAIWRLVEHADDYLARQLLRAFDREPLTSPEHPGRWHGMKYYGDSREIFARFESVWPGFSVRE